MGAVCVRVVFRCSSQFGRQDYRQQALGFVESQTDGQAQFSEVTVHVNGPSVTQVDADVLGLTTAAMAI